MKRKIEKFLDVIFGFLMRRTDFYHIMTPDQKKLGFPPGVSARMVIQSFERYKSLFERYEEERQADLTSRSNPVPSDQTPKVDSTKPVLDSTIQEVNGDVENTPRVAAQEVPSQIPVANDDSKSSPTVYQSDPECYNGATRDAYTWSQTIKDIDIRVKVPPSVKTAKDLRVAVDRKRIQIALKADEVNRPYFDGILCWDILKDDAVWTLHPKENHIHFCLDKVQERWWEAAFEGEDKINTRKIDCSRPMHELDEEAQAKIHQLMYDEQRKRQGLPTSEQQRMQDMLAKAWNQEGSPFRGTPFDPSKINIAPS
ncbi:unnamed protein product [Dicrocoelium dendriticum]|nr:unnamed protein product [Dicrocoelium dendriticum]